MNDLSCTGLGDVMVQPDGRLSRSTSDRRLKEDIKPITHALDKILRLKGVSYYWKNLPKTDRTLAVIAQDVLNVVPDIVTHDGEHYGVNYSEIPAILIEAIKEQQDIIEVQRKEIQILKTALHY